MKNKKNAKKGPGNICEHSLSYSELAPTDPWCNMLETLLGRKKYEEGMSDEQAPLLLILWNSLITFDGTPNVFQNDQMLIRSDQILAKRHYSMDSQVTLLIFVASILSHKSWHVSTFFWALRAMYMDLPLINGRYSKIILTFLWSFSAKQDRVLTVTLSGQLACNLIIM